MDLNINAKEFIPSNQPYPKLEINTTNLDQHDTFFSALETPTKLYSLNDDTFFDALETFAKPYPKLELNDNALFDALENQWLEYNSDMFDDSIADLIKYFIVKDF